MIRGNRLAGGGATCALLCATSSAFAGGVHTAGMGEIEVTAVRYGLLGDPESATDGIVLREQLEHRPLLRAGELLEAVPGLIVTQHSGSMRSTATTTTSATTTRASSRARARRSRTSTCIRSSHAR